MKQICKDLPAVWIVVIVYQFITFILIGFLVPKYFLSPVFIISRSIILIYLIMRHKYKNSSISGKIPFADVLVIYILLSVFYGETGQINSIFFNKTDIFLSLIDEKIFGFQPSVMFSQHFNNPLFSEIMYFGYFSYYLTPFFAFLLIWIFKRPYFVKFSFLWLSSYFVYYLIFILIPAEGPQFYFQPPLNQIEAQGFFGHFIKLIQKNGEAPTGAFPSSHVGVSVLILILLFKEYKLLFRIYLPLVAILLFSTVYIKAHYFVDVIAGIVSSPIVLGFNKLIFKKLNSQKTPYHVDRN